MTTTSNITPSHNRQIVSSIIARAAQVGFVLLVQAAILFFASGRFDWTWAWVFLGIYVVSVAVNSALLLRRNPETVAERGTASFERHWDKILGMLWGIAQFLVLPLIAALDVRFGWSSELSTAWHVAGGALFATGLALFGWAMIANAYFSTTVHIQSERGHAVCRSGPYRMVRHPGYTGTLLQSVGMPLLLGSWWALIPGVLAAACMIARTAFEDKMLQAELPGYAEFARDVRFRLIPGIW
jgi:protein-S-isoprenylcysteine O-methyltransferase Ste14